MTLPIINFLTQRLKEFDPSYELRQGTAFTDLFIKPQALIVQPLRDEANEIQTNQSLKRIFDLEDPDAYPEDAVDEILQNIYVFRRQGSKTGGSVRILYAEAKPINIIAGSLQFTNQDSLIFTNRNNFTITAQQMANQIDGDFFYVDMDIEADEEGLDYETAINGIIATTDSDAVRVFNAFPLSGGADRETNTEIIIRAQKSIGERSLNTGKGFNATIFQAFLNQITELQPIGMGDPEMMRDILFNYHLGGRVDGYVKTPVVLDGFFDVNGLTIDFTRQLSTATNLFLEGTDPVSLGYTNLDTSKNNIRAFNVDEVDKEAIFFSYINIAGGIDLTTGEFIGLSINDGPYKNVKISGANPANTQPGEIINRINVSLEQKVASIVTNPLVVTRRSTANTNNPTQALIKDPTPDIFKNVVPGDSFTILVGPNKGPYTIQTVVSSNELILSTNVEFEEQEINYRISRTGTFIKIVSPVKGAMSSILIGSPTAGSDGLPVGIGLPSSVEPYEFKGRGRIEYQETVDFTVDLFEGTTKRVIGTTIVPNSVSGFITKDIHFDDASTDVFINVEAGDVLTILSASEEDYEKDYKVLEKVNNNRIRIDGYIPLNEGAVEYRITRTGIKNKSLVFFSFDYNPLSIDIGDQVQLDEFGRVKGIREGREEETITDLSLLYIKSIELIDPVSGEPLDITLEGRGGFGRGTFGQGGFGRGSSAEWRHIVNKPELRFSPLEDSYIDISSGYLGQSFRVNYAYVPEIRAFQAFVKSDSERTLDADTLMKHFIPAVVDIDLAYTTNPNYPTTPSVDVIRQEIADFINKRKSGVALDASDIIDVVNALIDPSRTRDARVTVPIKMVATVHNADASLTIIQSADQLAIPEETIPAFTTRPLSPRIAHWIAGEITLTETRLTTGGI